MPLAVKDSRSMTSISLETIRPVTIPHLQQWKTQGRRITMLTAWDFLLAEILDQAGVDVILVGDSLGMVALGHSTTLPVTLDHMVHHTQAVRRGVKRALLVADLPCLSYQASPAQALTSAGRLLQEAGVQAVKLEGAYPSALSAVKLLVEVGVPVLGHVGLTPQSIHQLGSFRQQGQSPAAAAAILEDALALEAAGVFAVILEHIPAELAQAITEKLQIPTIGIGAGPHCDGQVLVTADLLGMSAQSPPFAPAYAQIRQTMTESVQTYCQDVLNQTFGQSFGA